MPKGTTTAPPPPAACLSLHLSGIKAASRCATSHSSRPQRTRFKETRTDTTSTRRVSVLFIFLVGVACRRCAIFPTCALLTCLWSAHCLYSRRVAAVLFSPDRQVVLPSSASVPASISIASHCLDHSPVSGRNNWAIWKGRPRLPQSARYTSKRQPMHKPYVDAETPLLPSFVVRLVRCWSAVAGITDGRACLFCGCVARLLWMCELCLFAHTTTTITTTGIATCSSSTTLSSPTALRSRSQSRSSPLELSPAPRSIPPSPPPPPASTPYAPFSPVS
ncbi:uncharacterized protein J3D65DRAFT_116815 [Phyllosticta citribraziliensis]|uniref:Uncharacterized protein n=1 Tax=Phyllosticta citribraziliensis TaxID=989973 RepID=A0ABR1LAM8_9PEZI